MYVVDYISLISSKDEKCFSKISKENQNTYFMFKTFFSDKRSVYGRMKKRWYSRRKPQLTIWRKRITCWKTKATVIPFTLQ